MNSNQNRVRHLQIKKRKIFVRKLGKNIDEEILKNYFSQFGEVESVNVLRSFKTQQSRRVGHVIFVTIDDALKVLSHKGPHIIQGRVIKCEQCLLAEEINSQKYSKGGSLASSNNQGFSPHKSFLSENNFRPKTNPNMFFESLRALNNAPMQAPDNLSMEGGFDPMMTLAAAQNQVAAQQAAIARRFVFPGQPGAALNLQQSGQFVNGYGGDSSPFWQNPVSPQHAPPGLFIQQQQQQTPVFQQPQQHPNQGQNHTLNKWGSLGMKPAPGSFDTKASTPGPVHSIGVNKNSPKFFSTAESSQAAQLLEDDPLKEIQAEIEREKKILKEFNTKDKIKMRLKLLKSKKAKIEEEIADLEKLLSQEETLEKESENEVLNKPSTSSKLHDDALFSLRGISGISSASGQKSAGVSRRRFMSTYIPEIKEEAEVEAGAKPETPDRGFIRPVAKSSQKRRLKIDAIFLNKKEDDFAEDAEEEDRGEFERPREVRGRGMGAPRMGLGDSYCSDDDDDEPLSEDEKIDEPVLGTVM